MDFKETPNVLKDTPEGQGPHIDPVRKDEDVIKNCKNEPPTKDIEEAIKGVPLDEEIPKTHDPDESTEGTPKEDHEKVENHPPTNKQPGSMTPNESDKESLQNKKDEEPATPSGNVDKDKNSSIDVRFGYPEEMHQEKLGNFGPRIDALPLKIEGIFKDHRPVHIKFQVNTDTTLDILLRYLEDEFGLKLDLEHEEEVLDDSKLLVELGLFKEVAVQAKHKEKTRVLTHASNKGLPDEINGIGITFWFGQRRLHVIAPCGATMKAVWERNFTDEGIYRPRLFHEGVTLDLDQVVGRLDFEGGMDILVMEEQHGGGPLAHGLDDPNNSDAGDFTYGYHKEMYDLRPHHPSVDGIWLKIEGTQAQLEILAQPETPFGAVTKHLYLEFGLSISLLYKGEELADDETPLEKRMYHTANLTAIHLLEEQVPELVLPDTILGMAIYFNIHGSANPDHSVPLGRIVPCGATMKAIWDRNFPIKPYQEPRFLLDSDRLYLHQVIGGANMEEGVIIDVFPGMHGGGPGMKRSQPDGEEEETPENAEDGYSFPSQPSAGNPATYLDSQTSDETNGIPFKKNTTIGTTRTPQVPTFKGKGVRTFFKRYDAWCNAGNLSPDRRLESLYFFLADEEENDILSFAENLDAWEEGDFEGVKAEMLRAFQENKADKYTVADMDAYLAQSRAGTMSTLEQINRYIVGYKEIGNALKKFGRITESTFKESFLAGLPFAVLERLERQDMEPRRQYTNPSFSQIEDDVRSVFNPQGYYAKFRHTNDQEADRKKHPDRIRLPQVTQTGTATKRREDDGMKELTEQMKTMALNLNRMIDQGYVQPPVRRGLNTQGYQNSNIPPAAPANIPPANSYSTPYRGDPTRQTNTQPTHVGPPTTSFTACHYCNDPGHGKRQCQQFQTHLAQGIVIEGPDGRMRAPDGGLLPWRPGQMNNIAQQRYNEWKAAQGTQSTNNHHQYDFGEEQGGIIGTANLHEYHLSHNAQSLPSEVNEKRGGEPLEKRAPKKHRATETQTEAPEGQTRADAMEEEEDVELTEGAGETPKKRKPPSHHLLSQVQEQFSVTKAVEGLLKKGSITLTVEEFVGMNKEVERELSRRFKSRRIPLIGPKVHFSNTAATAGTDGENELLFYTHSLPMIEVTIDGQVFKALIDTGSELDMISPKVVKLVRAAVRRDGLHRVIGIGNRPETLGGVCERLPVTIGGITNTIHAWVREGLSYDLLLGMPTITRFNMACKITKEGLSWIELKNQEGVRVRILAVKAKDPRDRRYLPPNLNRRRTTADDSDDETSASE
ncbi:unnamed protein product [Tilletia laevis]|uniref:Peptidase A2 domain-containing protein n=2 Tax=Tilletia TaxID=13289 RepID=A0A9N8Q9P2_9BASI|nr:hypothetical protein CF336_g7106 [Tilletia laevis]KAE8250340.1 hypothetical protein A4X03_0g6459 [Tilletia caries]KAE8189883.1 hypothetical protein CF335_g6507 [Tilletia laevis]CAD6893433.1 unnamed protein product [Tilletia caries]CAD6907477.1 unnamed protein product [Tilletia laevis]